MAARLKTKINATDRDARLVLDDLASPQARAKMLADGAREMLREADESNRLVLGRVPRNQTWVDGREGVPLEQVSDNGVIVREYDLAIAALFFIAEQLREFSPVGKGPDKRPGHPGFYRDSHTLFADGVEVPVGSVIPDANEFVFLSAAPYARKTEARFVVYERTAARAKSRFSNIARVDFTWRSPLYAMGAMTARSYSKDTERATRYPAITVRVV